MFMQCTYDSIYFISMLYVHALKYNSFRVLARFMILEGIIILGERKNDYHRRYQDVLTRS